MKQSERYLGEGLHPRVLVEVSFVTEFLLAGMFFSQLPLPLPICSTFSAHTFLCFVCKLSYFGAAQTFLSFINQSFIYQFNPCTFQGFEAAKKAALEFLETYKEPVAADDRELLRCVARTSLRTKIYETLADQLTDIVVDAVLTIRKPEEPIDLFMVRRSILSCLICGAMDVSDFFCSGGWEKLALGFA